MEAAGPSLAQASQATHMDTIDTDTQTNRDLLQGGSYLRYAGTSPNALHRLLYTRHEAIARGPRVGAHSSKL